jgi:hypothetical protein
VIVSRRSHEQRLRPRFVYREAPMGAVDSGWSALVGDETREELDDPGAMVAQPVADLVARWPELQAVLDTDEPASQWQWDDDRQAYVRLAAPGC